MKISEIITVNDIVFVDASVSKKQLINDLTAKAADTTGVDGRTLFDIVYERESLGSTAFGEGSALPHGRIPTLKKITGIFAKLATGVEFDASDHKPVDLVFLLLSPEHSGADHLNALSQISKIMRNGELCKKLRNTESAEEVHKILAS